MFKVFHHSLIESGIHCNSLHCDATFCPNNKVAVGEFGDIKLCLYLIIVSMVSLESPLSILLSHVKVLFIFLWQAIFNTKRTFLTSRTPLPQHVHTIMPSGEAPTKGLSQSMNSPAVVTFKPS